MRFRLSAVLCLSLLVSFVAVGCDETEMVAVRVDLKDAGNGFITTTTMTVPEGPSTFESQCPGVTWMASARLLHCRGSFKSLKDMQVGDIRFGRSDSAGLKFLRIVLPRGQEAKWPDLLAPTASERERAITIFDPDKTNASTDAGATVKLQVTLPGRIVAHGVTPTVRGVQEDVEGRVATLLVPVSVGRAKDKPDLVWHLSWE